MSGLKHVFQKMRDTSTEILELTTIKTFGVVYGESLTADRERERERMLYLSVLLPPFTTQSPKLQGLKWDSEQENIFLVEVRTTVFVPL